MNKIQKKIKKRKSPIIFILAIGIPIAVLIIVLCCINIYIFSPVPSNDYYKHTHTVTNNMDEAVSITEGKLPVERMKIDSKDPVSEEYIIEHLYDLPYFKNSLSFSAYYTYGNDNAEKIEIFIPLTGDSRENYYFDKIEAKKESRNVNIVEKNIIIDGEEYKAYEFYTDSKYEKTIIDGIINNVEYFITGYKS